MSRSHPHEEWRIHGRPGWNLISISITVAATIVPAIINTIASRSISIKTLTLPVYYAGVGAGSEVHLSWGGSLAEPTKWAVPANSTATVLADHTVRVTGVTMAPNSFLWCVVSE